MLLLRALLEGDLVQVQQRRVTILVPIQDISRTKSKCTTYFLPRPQITSLSPGVKSSCSGTIVLSLSDLPVDTSSISGEVRSRFILLNSTKRSEANGLRHCSKELEWLVTAYDKVWFILARDSSTAKCWLDFMLKISSIDLNISLISLCDRRNVRLLCAAR